jgi:hypothetical protein
MHDLYILILISLPLNFVCGILSKLMTTSVSSFHHECRHGVPSSVLGLFTYLLPTSKIAMLCVRHDGDSIDLWVVETRPWYQVMQADWGN